MNQRVTDLAAGVGLDFRLEKAQRANTFDAHRLLHLADARGVQADLAERLLDALGRSCGRVRVELEAAVGDGHVLGVREGRQRGLEPTLADVAPGAHHVREDLDLHACGNGGPSRGIPSSSVIRHPLPRRTAAMRTVGYPHLTARRPPDLQAFSSRAMALRRAGCGPTTATITTSTSCRAVGGGLHVVRVRGRGVERQRASPTPE